MLPEEEWRFRAKDGREIWGIVSGVRSGGPAWVIHITDVTRYCHSLRAAEAKLREVTNRLYTVQEAERRQIASELHDSVGQKLASLVIELELFQERSLSVRRSFALRKEFRKLHHLIDDVAENVHNAATRLRPSVLEYLSLPDALRALTESMQKRGQTEFNFIPGAVPKKIPPDAALCLYRVAQEALSNVVKHSHSDRAVVKLARGRQGLELTVQDFGAGFNRASSAAGHLGLLTMEERVRAIGGFFVLESDPGKGTCIHACLPPQCYAQMPAPHRRSGKGLNASQGSSAA